MPEYRNRSSAPQISHAMPAGDYVKMFPDLSALRIDEGVLRSLAQEMARPSCVGENPDCPAGYTYFGQFIAHDISLMCKTGNRRRAALKLESVYGSADEDWSGLYRDGEAGDVMFVLGVGCDRQGRPSNEYDLPRRAGGMPGIPDPRNDFHTIISQLHLAFMRLHNRVARDFRRVSPEKSPTAIFAETRRKIGWLYQWLVVNDFLRRICDRELMRHVWPGDNVVDPRFASFISQYEQKIPHEFALAGFRFGHSMVRPAYRLNCALPPRPIFHEHGDTFWNADLRGHRELLVRWSVQWDHFVGHGNPQMQYSCRMSPAIAPSLVQLPRFTIAEDEELRAMVNLAERTLSSGNGLLPSGQAIARVVSETIFPWLGLPSFSVLDPLQSDPLWYYILKEAAQEGEGCRLGQIGSWIVVATITNLLIKDNSSFVHALSWEPDLPVEGNAFELADLIRYAGLPFTQADWESYVEGRVVVV